MIESGSIPCDGVRPVLHDFIVGEVKLDAWPGRAETVPPSHISSLGPLHVLLL